MSKIKANNSTIKILALFISVVLWSYVRGEINPRISREFRDIKVDIINENIIKDSGLVILEPKELKVNIRLSGRRNDISALKREDIIAEVDMISTSKGTYRLPIQIRVPFKIDIEDINNRYALFEIDSIETVQKEVRINSSRNEIISPKIINVKGPSTLINKISRVTIDYNINKLRPNERISVPVIALDSKGKEIKGISLSPKNVQIVLPEINNNTQTVDENIDQNKDEEIQTPEDTVKEETLTLQIPISNIEIINLDEGLKSTIQSESDKIKVVLQGDANILSQVTVNDLKLRVDLKGLVEGNYKLKILLSDLENISIQEIKPSDINVIIESIQ